MLVKQLKQQNVVRWNAHWDVLIQEREIGIKKKSHMHNLRVKKKKEFNQLRENCHKKSIFSRKLGEQKKKAAAVE